MTLIITFSLLIGVMGLAHYLDARFGWQFVQWCNGKTVSPFKPAQQCTNTVQQSEMAALRHRIETLEAIITDTSFELNQKINRL